MTASIALLASSNPSVIHAVERIVRRAHDLRLETVAAVEQAWTRVPCAEVVLLLMHLPADADETPFCQLARQVTAASELCRIVVLADVYQAAHAAAFRQAGVAHYLGGPFDFAKLEALIREASTKARSALGAPTTSVSGDSSVRDPSFYVLDAEFATLMEQVRRTAPQDTTLLFTGETGTGKTRLARLVHELSPRRTEPFLVMDCAALSANLIESELFGHVRGAFTGADRDRAGKLAAVDRGTLLLDEVNALPLALQSKLLRAVDDRVFEPVGSDKTHKLHARLIAISATALDQDVKGGRFRADLYYRLNVVSFFLPPLRERRGMIAPLALKFLAEFAERNRPDIRGADPESLRLLEEYHWPGNIRELRNIIERAVALSPGPDILVRDLPEAIRAGRSATLRVLPVRGPEPVFSFTLNQSRERAEMQRILEALRKNHNNRLRTAAELGISRMGLYKKLRKYGLMNNSASA